MLAWPSFAMLKQSLPECQITALVPNYTAPIAQLCPWIDDVMIDPTSKADKTQQAGLVSQIKQRDFDAAICLFSNGYNAKLLWRAGIPYRLAPATKLAQLLFTRRLKQRRSRSEKPEFEYNLDLIRYFLADNQVASQEPQGPYLAFAEELLATQKAQLVAQLALDASKPWCFIHVGSGGSANNLSLEQYAALIKGVAAKHNCEFVLTAGPGEEAMAASLHTLIKLMSLPTFMTKTTACKILPALWLALICLLPVRQARCISPPHLIFRPLAFSQASAQRRRYAGRR